MNQLLNDKDFSNMLIVLLLIVIGLLVHHFSNKQKRLYISAVDRDNTMPSVVQQSIKVAMIVKDADTLAKIDHAKHVVKIFEMDNPEDPDALDAVKEWNEDLALRLSKIIYRRKY